ncbi:DUF397 domain-containing protein [Streptomyces scopuliridis]|uniref:DUF397 domain-containing protein n=1 Tax=Streptomyces scopuliridis TaxID=452529 RepID=UPI0035DEC915
MSSEINWQKSSFSGDGPQCVEVAEHDGAIVMRESDDPYVLTIIGRSNFAAFIAGVKAGEFDHFTD